MQLERQLQVRFQEMVKTQLGLTDEKLQAVEGVMQSFQNERMTLGRNQASLRHRLQDPVLLDISEEDAQEILREMVSLQEREIELYRREQEQLLTHLSASQLVRFYALREQMGRRMQQLRQGRGGPGGPPGVGGRDVGQGWPGRGGGTPLGLLPTSEVPLIR
jgi:hypothetical protein